MTSSWFFLSTHVLCVKVYEEIFTDAEFLKNKTRERTVPKLTNLGKVCRQQSLCDKSTAKGSLCLVGKADTDTKPNFQIDVQGNRL